MKLIIIISNLVQLFADRRLLFESEAKYSRRMAKKYKLDFTVECVFDHQLKSYGCPKDGEICRVKMQSGATAEYRAKVTRVWPGGTGQKSWLFEFLKYLPSK